MAKTDVIEERVEVHIPRGPANDDPNLFVSINGVNYILPRGKTSKVPKFVADEIHRAERAAERQNEKRDALLEAPLLEFGK